MPSLDAKLARHAAGVRFEQLSPEAIEAAKIFLLDSLGVGVAGGSTPEITPLLAAVSQWGEGAPVTLWGRQATLTATQAAAATRVLLLVRGYACMVLMALGAAAEVEAAGAIVAEVVAVMGLDCRGAVAASLQGASWIHLRWRHAQGRSPMHG